MIRAGFVAGLFVGIKVCRLNPPLQLKKLYNSGTTVDITLVRISIFLARSTLLNVFLLLNLLRI